MKCQASRTLYNTHLAKSKQLYRSKPMLTRVSRQTQLRLLTSIAYTPPDLIDLPRRWTQISPPVKDEMREYLTWKMEDDWKGMTIEEIKAIYYISYGGWGPRAANGGSQMSPTYLVWKGLFNIVLFAALGVSVLNLKRDKAVDESLKRLRALENGAST